VRRARKIRSSTQALLLEAARRKDESAILRNRIGDLERHFRPKELDPRQRSLNTDETAVLRAFDGPRRLGDVVEQSELGDIETLMALESLIRSAHIVEAMVEAPRSARVPASSPGVDKPERVPASVPPFSFAWPPEPKPAHGNTRWLVSTLVMALVVSAAAWIGAMDSRNRSSVAAPLTPAASPSPPRDPGSYPVVVRVVPADATLEVDGRRIGSGSWTTRLPRDGMLHELRISAEGFVPARILFVDTAPPLDVRLDPLPLPPVAEAAPELPEAAPAQPASAPLASRRKPSWRKPLAAARVATDVSPEPAPRPSSPKRKPYVQLIDAEAAGAATANQ